MPNLPRFQPIPPPSGSSSALSRILAERQITADLNQLNREARYKGWTLQYGLSLEDRSPAWIFVLLDPSGHPKFKGKRVGTTEQALLKEFEMWTWQNSVVFEKTLSENAIAYAAKMKLLKQRVLELESQLELIKPNTVSNWSS